MRAIWRLMFVSLLVLAAPAACGDDDGAAPEDAPPGHTVVQEGVAHRPGLRDPNQNCTGCHGADLRGGADGEPSCYSCHGQKWP